MKPGISNYNCSSVEIRPYENIHDYILSLRNKSIWLSKQASQAIVSVLSKEEKV